MQVIEVNPNVSSKATATSKFHQVQSEIRPNQKANKIEQPQKVNVEEANLSTAAEAENANSKSSQNVEAVSVGAVTSAPRVLREKKISYPISARRAGVEGVVELKLVIDRDGHVQSAELVRGPGYGLDEAALSAIKEFIFSPAQIGDQTVAVRIIYKYRFKLGG
jgi:TonB family protein